MKRKHPKNIKPGDVVMVAGTQVTIEKVDGDRIDIVWFENWACKRANVPARAAIYP